MVLRLVPMHRDPAFAYLRRVHRHHGAPQGYKFAIGVADDGRLCGVAVAGRPVNRVLADGHTLEVTRVATDGTPNSCSILYAACWRAARALGYTRATTYTQDDESGASLRAAGWLHVATMRSRSGWDTPSRRRTPTGTEDVDRNRWEIRTADHHADSEPVGPDAVPADGRQMVLDLEAVA